MAGGGLTGVYTGRWTDYSKGPVLGNQVTLPTASGNILVATIAIFVTFCGTLTWSLIAFALFRARVTRSAKMGLHFQIQALLRSGISPTLFAKDIVAAGYAWKKHRRDQVFRALLQALCLAGLALLIYVSFTIAGLLLSLVSSTGDVLLRSSTCKPINITKVDLASQEDQNKFNMASLSWAMEEISRASSYAQACYSLGALDVATVPISDVPAADCNFYVKPALNFKTSHTNKCPFVGNVCKGSQVEFDTGLLDTLYDLGRNTPESDRVLFRRRTSCSPLITEGFTDGFVNDSTLGRVAFYNYGVNYVQPTLTPESLAPNYTFVYHYDSFLAKDTPYKLSVVTTSWTNDSGDGTTSLFVPDPRVAYNGTSMFLLFLANRAYYASVVVDPWFKATSVLPQNFLDYGAPLYYSEEPVSVLGCVDYVQICNPNFQNNTCRESHNFGKGHWHPDDEILDLLQFNAHQKELALDVGAVIYDSAIEQVVESLGARALVASRLLTDSMGSLLSIPVPEGQWLSELQQLQATSMALMQRWAYLLSAGPPVPELIKYMVPNTDYQWDCATQKYKNNNYMSFSSLGLGLIFGLGGVIILMNFITFYLLPTFRKRTGRRSLPEHQWDALDLLRLQCDVLENRRCGGVWTNTPGETPVTLNNDRFVAFTDNDVINESTAKMLLASTQSMDNAGKNVCSRADSPAPVACDVAQPGSLAQPWAEDVMETLSRVSV